MERCKSSPVASNKTDTDGVDRDYGALLRFKLCDGVSDDEVEEQEDQEREVGVDNLIDNVIYRQDNMDKEKSIDIDKKYNKL